MVLREAGAAIKLEAIEMGERLYKQGAADGILPSALEKLAHAQALLKAPTIEPQGADQRSVSLALRERFGLYGYAWPIYSPAPMLGTKNTSQDLGVRAGAAYVGESFALFEPLHGVAARLAGKNRANPSALLNAATLMLATIGQQDTARIIHSAWLRTIEDGVHTRDMRNKKTRIKAGTKEFAEAVAARLGQAPDGHLRSLDGAIPDLRQEYRLLE